MENHIIFVVANVEWKVLKKCSKSASSLKLKPNSKIFQSKKIFKYAFESPRPNLFVCLFPFENYMAILN